MASDYAAGDAGIATPFDVPADWTTPRLSTHCRFVRDGDWIESKDQGGRDYRLLQVSNVGVGRFVETGNFRWITQDTFTRLNCTEILPGDVLVARMPDPTGRAWYVSELPWRAVTAVDIAIIRTRPNELDPQFLSYVLNSPQYLALVHGLTTGTTRLRIRRADIERLCVPLPPLPEQGAIAGMLGALDEKIELNRRMTETLEAMAQALFKSWFVDFEPVRAKAEGRDPELPPPLADLFPASFEDSELGAIPMGWKARGLNEIAYFLNGLALQKYPAGDGESLPVIKIAQLRSGHTAGSDRASTAVPPNYVVDDGDVLFSWSGSLEVVMWAGGRGALNQHLFKVTSTTYPKWFFYMWTFQHLPEFRRIAAAKATTMGHIQRHHLSEARVVVPPQDLLRAADQYLAPLIDAQPALRAQSRLLAVVRDQLLPKVVSGDVRLLKTSAFPGEGT